MPLEQGIRYLKSALRRCHPMLGVNGRERRSCFPGLTAVVLAVSSLRQSITHQSIG
jgi:hypothetical protein